MGIVFGNLFDNFWLLAENLYLYVFFKHNDLMMMMHQPGSAKDIGGNPPTLDLRAKERC